MGALSTVDYEHHITPQQKSSIYKLIGIFKVFLVFCGVRDFTGVEGVGHGGIESQCSDVPKQ